jgi:hypothetical protein
MENQWLKGGLTHTAFFLNFERRGILCADFHGMGIAFKYDDNYLTNFLHSHLVLTNWQNVFVMTNQTKRPHLFFKSKSLF